MSMMSLLSTSCAWSPRAAAFSQTKVTILGMSSDVISDRCRQCVEDVVAKARVVRKLALGAGPCTSTESKSSLQGKFEFVDKETYGEYIQARCHAP